MPIFPAHTRIKPNYLTFFIPSTIILLDQSSKWIAGQLSTPYTNNLGPFSLPWPNIMTITLGFMVIAAAWRTSTSKNLPNTSHFGLLLIVGGGLSNLADRVILAHTVDIVAIGTAQFNVADLAILSGAATVVWSLLQQGKQGK